MNYDTKSYRKRYGIPMGLKLGYRNVWAERMPAIIQMIGQGLKLKDIGKHYGCSAVNVGAAMRRAGVGSIHNVRINLKGLT